MIRELEDTIDIAITTNGVLLSKYAQELAMLDSQELPWLDSLLMICSRKCRFKLFSDDVLDGINAAIECNLPVKITPL